jgi:hypothetical protein
VGPFEYYFSFFTLIIGLALAAVARGFGTLWQSRRRMPVGYLTPLLAAFLLLDMSRFWVALWNRQEIASLDAVALASVLCVTLPYVFATTIMFPVDLKEWTSLDEYYQAHSRPIFIALLASKIAGYVFDSLLFPVEAVLSRCAGNGADPAAVLHSRLVAVIDGAPHRAGLPSGVERCRVPACNLSRTKSAINQARELGGAWSRLAPGPCTGPRPRPRGR